MKELPQLHHHLSLESNIGSFVTVMLPPNITIFSGPSSNLNMTLTDYQVSINSVALFSSSQPAYASSSSSTTFETPGTTTSKGLRGESLAAAIIIPLLLVIIACCWWYWTKLRHGHHKIHQDQLTVLQSHAEKQTVRGQYILRSQLPQKSVTTIKTKSSQNSEKQFLEQDNIKQYNRSPTIASNRIRLDPIISSTLG